MSRPFELNNGMIVVVVEAPGGLYNATQLAKVAELCEGSNMAVTMATEDHRLALFVAKDKEDHVRQELGTVGLAARHYRDGLHQPVSCIGELCPDHEQDALTSATDLTKALAAINLKTPLKIGINGCAQCCVPCHTFDISLIADGAGYIMSLGGKNSQIPEMASFVAESIPSDKVVGLTKAVVEKYAELVNSDDDESLQDVMDRCGAADFIALLAPYSQDAADDDDPFGVSLDDSGADGQNLAEGGDAMADDDEIVAEDGEELDLDEAELSFADDDQDGGLGAADGAGLEEDDLEIDLADDDLDDTDGDANATMTAEHAEAGLSGEDDLVADELDDDALDDDALDDDALDDDALDDDELDDDELDDDDLVDDDFADATLPEDGMIEDGEIALGSEPAALTLKEDIDVSPAGGGQLDGEVPISVADDDDLDDITIDEGPAVGTDELEAGDDPDLDGDFADTDEDAFEEQLNEDIQQDVAARALEGEDENSADRDAAFENLDAAGGDYVASGEATYEQDLDEPLELDDDVEEIEAGQEELISDDGELDELDQDIEELSEGDGLDFDDVDLDEEFEEESLTNEADLNPEPAAARVTDLAPPAAQHLPQNTGGGNQFAGFTINEKGNICLHFGSGATLSLSSQALGADKTLNFAGHQITFRNETAGVVVAVDGIEFFMPVTATA